MTKRSPIMSRSCMRRTPPCIKTPVFRATSQESHAFGSRKKATGARTNPLNKNVGTSHSHAYECGLSIPCVASNAVAVPKTSCATPARVYPICLWSMPVAFTICALTIAYNRCASEILISENVYYIKGGGQEIPSPFSFTPKLVQAADQQASTDVHFKY